MIDGIYQGKHYCSCLMKEDYLIIEEFEDEIIRGSGSLGSPVHTMKGDVTGGMQLS